MKEAMQRAMVTHFITILGRDAVEAMVRAMDYNLNGFGLTFNGQKEALISMMGHQGSMCECYRGNPIWEVSDSCAGKAWESATKEGKAEVFDDFWRWIDEENVQVVLDVLSASH